MSMSVHLRLFAAVILALSVPAAGQWLKYKTPGIPRTADGSADLKAAAPKTHDGKPDLSGIWRGDPGGYGLNVAAELKPSEIQSWAEKLYKERLDNLAQDSPMYRCMPQIGPYTAFGMFKILQTPAVIGVLSEGGVYRQILTDGRPLPEDPNPTWMGYSVGHWEGDTLVVENAGFNDKTWLDAGHPHSEGLRVTERFHRKDFGHMDLKMTFSDPKIYARPFSINVELELVPDTELLEYVCNENEQSLKHFVITEADRKLNRTNAKVAPEILAKYAGIYEMQNPEDPKGKPVSIWVLTESDQLLMQMNGAGPKIALLAQSNTTFTVLGGTVVFATDDRGAVTHFTMQAVEGDFKIMRKGDLPAAATK
jgi:hypothetical protein